MLAPTPCRWSHSIPPSIPPGLAHRRGEEPGPGAHAEGAAPHRVSGLAVGRGGPGKPRIHQVGGLGKTFSVPSHGMEWWEWDVGGSGCSYQVG